MLVETFGGVIPRDIETLMKLPGVGRKTADVIASVIYKVPAIAVDTHVFRTSHRLGLSRAKTPEATELDLQKLLPRENGPMPTTGSSGTAALPARPVIRSVRNASAGTCVLPRTRT